MCRSEVSLPDSKGLTDRQAYERRYQQQRKSLKYASQETIQSTTTSSGDSSFNGEGKIVSKLPSLPPPSQRRSSAKFMRPRLSTRSSMSGYGPDEPTKSSTALTTSEASLNTMEITPKSSSFFKDSLKSLANFKLRSSPGRVFKSESPRSASPSPVVLTSVQTINDRTNPTKLDDSSTNKLQVEREEKRENGKTEEKAEIQTVRKIPVAPAKPPRRSLQKSLSNLPEYRSQSLYIEDPHIERIKAAIKASRQSLISPRSRDYYHSVPGGKNGTSTPTSLQSSTNSLSCYSNTAFAFSRRVDVVASSDCMKASSVDMPDGKTQQFRNEYLKRFMDSRDKSSAKVELPGCVFLFIFCNHHEVHVHTQRSLRIMLKSLGGVKMQQLAQ